MLTCQKCKSEWFEILEVGKYTDDGVAYFQRPLATVTHFIAKCTRCNDIQELPVQENTGNKPVKDSYAELVKVLSDTTWQIELPLKAAEKKDESKGQQSIPSTGKQTSTTSSNSD